MKKYIVSFCFFTCFLTADENSQVQNKEIEDKRLENKRIEQQILDKKLQDKRLEDERLRRKIDDEIWERQHGR